MQNIQPVSTNTNGYVQQSTEPQTAFDIPATPSTRNERMHGQKAFPPCNDDDDENDGEEEEEEEEKEKEKEEEAPMRHGQEDALPRQQEESGQDDSAAHSTPTVQKKSKPLMDENMIVDSTNQILTAQLQTSLSLVTQRHDKEHIPSRLGDLSDYAGIDDGIDDSLQKIDNEIRHQAMATSRSSAEIRRSLPWSKISSNHESATQVSPAKTQLASRKADYLTTRRHTAHRTSPHRGGTDDSGHPSSRLLNQDEVGLRLKDEMSSGTGQHDDSHASSDIDHDEDVSDGDAITKLEEYAVNWRSLWPGGAFARNKRRERPQWKANVYAWSL